MEGHIGDGGRRDRLREEPECKDGNMTAHSIPKVADRKSRKARVNLLAGHLTGPPHRAQTRIRGIVS